MTDMRQSILFVLFCAVAAVACGREPVLPGVMDFDRYGAMLQGKRVALAGNATSVVMPYHLVGEERSATDSPRHTLDFLREKGVNVVKVFCPEHGFRGDADAGAVVGDYTDARTGLPVVSLYGKKKKPAPADMEGVDVVVFDMQDVGVRFYTYLSTLHYLMEACAENRCRLVLLDRPNPNAFYVDGPVLQPSYRSFVGMHPVPVVYGMTIGEYARMVNGEGWLSGGEKCDLTVVPCCHWHRETVVALPVNPSPNLPDAVSVMLYPSICFFEGTVVSEGRGTATPFQEFGHPDLRDMPYSFTPRSIQGMSSHPKCEGKVCRGMNLRDKYDEVKSAGRLRLDWLVSAYRSYVGKADFFTPFFDKLAGNASLREAVIAGNGEKKIRAMWHQEVDNFKRIRAKYLLY